MSETPSRPRRGLCLVLSAPSGTGKSSVGQALLQMEPELRLSVSATTRAARPGEEEGVHYFFRSHAEFDAMEAEGGLLESANVYGRRYGTPRAPVEAALAAGKDVLFDVDWQGHLLLKQALPQDVVGVFLLPPSIEELERRLFGRGQDDKAEIERRMANVREQIHHWHDFDHVLVNTDFAGTVAQVRAILVAARSTRDRQPWVAGFAEELLAQSGDPAAADG